jgi:uncharacterized protein (TIGR02145 family)
MKRNLLKTFAITILLALLIIGCKKEIHVTGVTIDKFDIKVCDGDRITLKVNILPENATNKTLRWESSNPDVATVASGIVYTKKAGKTTITVFTEDGNYTAKCNLTVISTELSGVMIDGVRWATRNVDISNAFAGKPHYPGMFYQWNRNRGWSSTVEITDWDGTIPQGPIWEEENDPCPTGWRVPTNSELMSLLNAGSRWTSLNDVSGRLYGSDDNLIFLPATGYRDYSNGTLVKGTGNYWSNTVQYQFESYFLLVDSIGLGANNTFSNIRTYGYSVRCVAE